MEPICQLSESTGNLLMVSGLTAFFVGMLVPWSYVLSYARKVYPSDCQRRDRIRLIWVFPCLLCGVVAMTATLEIGRQMACTY